jgi:hypothetical protein
MMKTVLATGVLLLAAGCGAGIAEQAATPTPTPPPVDGGAFDSPADIITKAGTTLPCSDAKAKTPIGAKAQTTCGDDEIVIRVYEDHSGVDDQVDLLSLGGAYVLTGENWSVNAPKATLEAAKAKLGGQLIHVKCQQAC